jgi:hypothetical protein
LACLAPVAALEPDAASVEVERLRKAIDESLTGYEFTAEPGGEPFKLVPAMRWGNATRGSATGLTALLVGERPEAVVCVYQWQSDLIHEFSSLSRGSFEGQRGGETFWQPQDAGLSFRPVPNADPPAESALARLRQIKALAGRFEATMLGWRADLTDRQELRRLPRPLYRYENEKPAPTADGGEVIDGAVIAFVMGTDPEVLLLIEAVRAGDVSRWEYAFVRRTSGALAGRLDGKEVWTAPGFPNGGDPKGVNRSVKIPLSDLLPQE